MFRRDKKPQIFTAAILSVVLIVALLLILATRSEADTPPVSLAPVSDKAPAMQGDAADYASYAPIVIDESTVRDALRELPRVTSYSRTLTIQSSWEGGSSQRQVQVWVRGESAHILEDGSRHVLLSDGELLVWYEDSATLWHGVLQDEEGLAVMDGFQGILTWEELLTEEADILHAGYTDLDSEPCIWAEYTRGQLGYRYFVYVSLNSGLLLRSETYDGSVCIGSMTAGTADVSTPADAYFMAPA